MHCDAVGSMAASVKDKHTRAHHPLHHASRYAVASPYWARTDIWSNLAQKILDEFQAQRRRPGRPQEIQEVSI